MNNLKLIPFKKRLKFSSLTPEQIEKTFNGCGSKSGLFIKVPDFIFRACCNHHDFKYWRGRGPSVFSWEFWRHPIIYFRIKKGDREVADLQFLKMMIIDAENSSEETKDIYIQLAHTYFSAVRKYGWFSYSWRQERTKNDLPI